MLKFFSDKYFCLLFVIFVKHSQNKRDDFSYEKKRKEGEKISLENIEREIEQLNLTAMKLFSNLKDPD